jgi:general secretion pathway protein K
MSAPSSAFSRCARRAAQRGAAVVLALLTVSFAAMLAAAALADFGHGLDMLGGRHDQAQAWQLGRAAVDWSRNILADDARRTPTDHLAEIWTTEIPVTAIGSDTADGSVGGSIRDLSGRFNLNDLARNGRPDPRAIARFARLLGLVGMSGAGANVTAQALATHLQGGPTDADPSTDPNAAAAAEAATGAGAIARGGRALVETRELVLLGLVPAATFAALEPHVVAAPAGAPININTASAEVLAAVIDGLSLDVARNLVAARERAWFRNLGDLQGRLPEGADLPAGRLLDVRSRYFLVTVTATYGDAVLNLQAMLDRESNWPDILWYHTP